MSNVRRCGRIRVGTTCVASVGLLTVCPATAGVPAPPSADAVVSRGAPTQASSAERATSPAVTRVLYAQHRAAIVAVKLGAPKVKQERVATLGASTLAVTGIAATGRHLYWSVLSGGRRQPGFLMRSTVNGHGARRVVAGLRFPAALVAGTKYLYWLDHDGIGRLALDGSSVRRQFIRPPQEFGGGVGGDLVSDGRYLYFSRCHEKAIARVPLVGGPVQLRFIQLRGPSCPQGLAIGGRYIYWTDLHFDSPGGIGRARLDGSGADMDWLRIRADSGPYELAADADEIFWTWRTNPNGNESYVGRARTDGRRATRLFLAADNAPALARCRGTECWTSSAVR